MVSENNKLGASCSADALRPTGAGAWTKGPWNIQPTYWARSPYEPEEAPRRVHSYGVPEAGAFGIPAEPNARLIAAAPDLYAVASKIDAMWSENLEPGEGPEAARSGAVREVWTQLRAALSLALGDPR